MASSRSNTAIDTQLGVRIRAARLQRKMSQQHLAGRIGVSFQQLQKYEDGQNRLSVGRFCLLAAALNVTAASLLEGFDKPDAEPLDLLEDLFSTPEGVDLVRAFRGARDTRLRRHIVSVVKAITQHED